MVFTPIKMGMKKITGIFILIVVFASPVFSRDYIVEFQEENYKETQAQFSYDPLIYHSIQVNSAIGPKLLILTGDNYNYRKWLRHYITLNKRFITRVPEDQIDRFVSSKAYEIDVTALHPVNIDKWKTTGTGESDTAAIQGKNHILVVDANEKRAAMIQIIAQRMGYPTTIFTTGKNALTNFREQPEKFSMVIAHHSMEEMPLDQFVEKIVDLSHTIPILVDTGYQNPAHKNQLASKFSDQQSVHIKPVILKNFQKTVEQLIGENA